MAVIAEEIDDNRFARHIPSILEGCEPRADLLTGSFNPETFKASLRQVLTDYANGTVSNPIYSDPNVFFTEATFPTDGLREVVRSAFGRLSGDKGFAVAQRLETAFGGGKTHTLIALAHLAKRGRDLAEQANKTIDQHYLPEAGEIDLIGVVGDAVDVQRLQGTNLVPHTLWGAIAERVGGDPLYQELRPMLESPSAPAAENPYFDRVFGGRKVLLIIDELAQYSARAEAARAGGAEQIAAFLMSLLTYAERHPHFAMVVTLASDQNTFGGYNKNLRAILKDSDELTEEGAVDLLSRSAGQVLGVISRSATGVTPVVAAELSKIMAQRLFARIDPEAARQVAAAYQAMYRRNGADLPAATAQEDFRDRIAAHYPFHPTFIEYLSQKLAQVENFQGTRGVLRTLGRLVRSVWSKRLDLPLLHTCHLDLADGAIRNELLGATESSDMISVLEADISKAGGAEAATGLTVAQQLDRENPHPRGYPLNEWAWKAVFLHSLVGRAGGLNDERYGIALGRALLETAQPQLPPPQVKSALQRIPREASYLREHEGRFYANTLPTLNNILRSIRGAVGEAECQQKIRDIARTLVTGGPFKVGKNVTESDQIPDKTDRPVLAILDPGTTEFDPVAFVTRCGGAPRLHQNYVFILSPSTALAKGEVWDEARVKDERDRQKRLSELAAWVIAADKLKAQPDRSGVNAQALQDADFVEVTKTRANDLRTLVEKTYSQLHYPNSSGNIACRRIHSAGGEGGDNLMALIRKALTEDGELINEDIAMTREASVNLGRLFFGGGDLVAVGQLRERFAQVRQWPVLESPQLLDTLLINGVRLGQWCLARLDDEASEKPTHYYTSANEPPASLNLDEGRWLAVTPAGASARGWGDAKTRDPHKLRGWTEQELATMEAATPDRLADSIEEKHGAIDTDAFREQLVQQIRQGRLLAFPERYLVSENPPQPYELVSGPEAAPEALAEADHAVITRAEASRRGWLQARPNQKDCHLSGENTIKRLVNVLAAGRFRGSETQIETFYLELALKSGGRHQFSLENITADGLARMNEVFQCLQGLIDFADEPLAEITVAEAAAGCELIQVLNVLEKD